MTYYDPNTNTDFNVFPPRASTTAVLKLYDFKDNSGNTLIWTPGQLEIIDCILNRSSPNALQRVEVIASTQYGKSIAVAAGITIRGSSHPEPCAIVAGGKEKGRVIMGDVV